MEHTNKIKTVEKKQPARVTLKVRLDKVVIDYFKDIENREDLINQILREEMEAQKARR